MFGTDQTVVKSPLSKMRNRHSDGVAWEVLRGNVHGPSCLLHHPRAMEKIMCWRAKLKRPKKQSWERRATVKKMENEWNRPAVQFEETSEDAKRDAETQTDKRKQELAKIEQRQNDAEEVSDVTEFARIKVAVSENTRQLTKRNEQAKINSRDCKKNWRDTGEQVKAQTLDEEELDLEITASGRKRTCW